MATTYIKIEKITVSAGTTTVIFNSIPQTYDDLVLKFSNRGTSGGWNGYYITFNNVGSQVYSRQSIQGNGASVGVASSSGTAEYSMQVGTNTIPSQDSYLFNAGEMYIPNYRVAQGKQMLMYGVGERNTTTAYMELDASYSNPTTAISSIKIINTTSNFVADSTFYLYGISHS
tara:strand:- start:528 stop:1046 length:519 start_codon:yes stop_codon:yes gene_type:complete